MGSKDESGFDKLAELIKGESLSKSGSKSGAPGRSLFEKRYENIVLRFKPLSALLNFADSQYAYSCTHGAQIE